jgi:hypothetical protein
VPQSSTTPLRTTTLVMGAQDCLLHSAKICSRMAASSPTASSPPGRGSPVHA